MKNIPFWAKEQLSLRKTFHQWVMDEIDRYDREGFQSIVGDKSGHALDEVGGYTREFVAAYSLSGEPRVAEFMKSFRDDWKKALDAAGHFWHGYDSNESGDYVTHTAEAFSQFLLNVLYLDPTDRVTIAMIEDAAEHIGNYSPDVHNWYDWDNHLFHTYFPGTKMNDFYGTPWNWQSGSHFRLLAVAVAAFDVTGDSRYLDVVTDYCGMWADAILSAKNDDETPVALHPYTEEESRAVYEKCLNASDARVRLYSRYFEGHFHKERPSTLGLAKSRGSSKHVFHDTVMTWLDVYRHLPEPRYAEALRCVMRGWVGWADGEEQVTQLAGQDPHCALHYPKYRDVTEDTSLDGVFLNNFREGIGAYLVSGEVERFFGYPRAAEAVFASTVRRNGDEHLACTHACSIHSNAGTTSAYIAPALFMPVFGGLNVHYGRAPWVNLLYYTGGAIGLPAEVAALYVPAASGKSRSVRLVNTGTEHCTVALRPVTMNEPSTLNFIAPAPDGLESVTLQPGEERRVTL